MPEALESIQRQLADEYLREIGRAGVHTEIHPSDEMLRSIGDVEENMERHRLLYFATGHAAAATVEHYLELLGRPLASAQRVLDFASGCGRVARFFAAATDPQRVWASDIDPIAVEFIRETFGVNAFESCTDPDKLELPGPFDVIFVGSLFTHLPEATFGKWLEKLYAALAPGGVLIFSLHGLATFPEVQAPESGFHFESRSETDRLKTSDYGTTYVSDAWIQDLASRIGIESLHARPRELWRTHDLWIASNRAAPELKSFAPVPLLYGSIDRIDTPRPNHLWVGGHVFCAPGRPAPTEVRLLLDGSEQGGVLMAEPRPTEGGQQFDWYTEGDVSGLPAGPHVITAVAHDAEGRRHCLDAYRWTKAEE